MRWSICVIVSLVHAGTRGENNKKQSALGEYTTPLNFRGTATPLLTRPRRLPTAAARGGGGGGDVRATLPAVPTASGKNHSTLSWKSPEYVFLLRPPRIFFLFFLILLRGPPLPARSAPASPSGPLFLLPSPHLPDSSFVLCVTRPPGVVSVLGPASSMGGAGRIRRGTTVRQRLLRLLLAVLFPTCYAGATPPSPRARGGGGQPACGCPSGPRAPLFHPPPPPPPSPPFAPLHTLLHLAFPPPPWLSTPPSPCTLCRWARPSASLRTRHST